MSGRVTHRGARVAGVWIGLLLACAPAAAQPAPPAVPPGVQFVSASPANEKAPRTSGDWVAWTRDFQDTGSQGTVVAKNLLTSQLYVLGQGFLPDIDVYAATKGGGAAVPAPGACGSQIVRVAFLRLGPGGELSLLNACFTGTTFSIATLVPDVGWADHVRVAGNYTTWSSPDEAGVLRIRLHDGLAVETFAGAGHAFRPELARAANGSWAHVWDVYVGGPGAFAYEVFGRFRAGTQPWSAVENLSGAPEGVDNVPSVAAAAGGAWWIAWESDRGGTGATRAFVVRRATDGTLQSPQPYPPSADPAALGTVNLTGASPSHRPHVQADADGRLWLVMETKISHHDKQVWASLYDGGAWSAPVLLPGEELGEKAADLVAAGAGVRVVYQVNTQLTRTLDVAIAELVAPEPASGVVLSPPAAAPAPATYPVLRLPEERTVVVDGLARTLLFADLHSHCGQSPDGQGERDRALFWARDGVRLDVWASTDHDEARNEPMLDWEYELGSRFVDLFDAPGFTTYMGYEWSNHLASYGDEVLGHRAAFATSRCHRFTDAEADELPELYALLAADDAIGVPHHLSKFGGSTFLQFDAFAQPVTEVSSAHGEFEDTLVEKLVVNQARFGVTSAGDDHTSTPGLSGVAGILIDPSIASRRDAVKAALRERLCFGARRHGMYVDFRVFDEPMGAELEHHGDVLVRVRIAEFSTTDHGHTGVGGELGDPGGESEAAGAAGGLVDVHGHEPSLQAALDEEAEDDVRVTISRNGFSAEPVYSRVVPPGGSLDDLVVLAGSEQDAFYMLRVTKGVASAASDAKMLWTSPIWVDAVPSAGHPTPTISPATGSIPSGEPFVLVLGLSDPEGLSNLADARLHVTIDGQLAGTLPLPALLPYFTASPTPAGAELSLALATLPAGDWGFVLELRDQQGHHGAAGTTISIIP